MTDSIQIILFIILLFGAAFLFCVVLQWISYGKRGVQRFLLMLKCMLTLKHSSWRTDDYDSYINKFPDDYLGKWKG